MSSNKHFTIHVIVSMIESGEWDTNNVFLKPPVNGRDNAGDKGDEDVSGKTSNLLGKQLIAQANFISYKEDLPTENSLEDDVSQDYVQIENKTKTKEYLTDS